MTPKLSICIPTFNRARYIAQTLESIAQQWVGGIEVVIVDGSANDATELIVDAYRDRIPDILYERSVGAEAAPSNEGFDRDCDRSVELSSGRYCWLMTDDDLFMPGAFHKVLSEIDNDYAVIVASAEIRNVDLTNQLVAKRPDIFRDRVFGRGDWDDFAVAVVSHLTFVGAVIIMRQLWLSRNRRKYYGTGFVHVGVIFDAPIMRRTLLISTPLISIRYGNAHWVARAFQIWMINWPELVWSFVGVSDRAKSKISMREPYRNISLLLYYRAVGAYSMQIYKSFLEGRLTGKFEIFLFKFVAILPRSILWLLALVYMYVARPSSKLRIFDLWESRSF